MKSQDRNSGNILDCRTYKTLNVQSVENKNRTDTHFAAGAIRFHSTAPPDKFETAPRARRDGRDPSEQRENFAASERCLSVVVSERRDKRLRLPRSGSSSFR